MQGLHCSCTCIATNSTGKETFTITQDNAKWLNNQNLVLKEQLTGVKIYKKNQ